MRSRQTGFTLLELLIVIAVIGVIAAITIPNLLEAMDRGRQKRSMADLRTIATSVEQYSIDNSFYPAVASESAVTGSALVAAVEPVYARFLPRTDGWVFDFRYASDTTDYTVGSLGKDGSLGGSLTVSGTGGPTHDHDCDIIFSGGSFVQWPEGIQTE